MLSSCRHSQSSIPGNASSCPGNTKKLHQYSISMSNNATLNMLICCMHDLLYTHNTILLLMDLFSSLMFVCRRSTFYILMNPTLPVSILTHMYLLFGCFLLLLFLLLLILHYDIQNCWSCHVKFLFFHFFVLLVLAHVMNCSTSFGTCLLWFLYAYSEWLIFCHLDQLLP